MNYDKIGEFIASKRKEKNMTQSDLAKKLGVTDKAVSKWERGLGCPDVSILEILSKELDVSILELLKGRKIENEVINITEADDYIKESYKESKQKFNNDLKRILSILIIFLSSLLVFVIIYFNISSSLRLTKKEDMDFTYSYSDDDVVLGPNTSFYDNVAKLKEYISILENNQGKLTDEEHTDLLKALKDFEKFYDESFLFKINKTTYFSYNDIYINLAKDYANYDFKYLSIMRPYRKYVGDVNNVNFSDYIRRTNKAHNDFITVYNNNFQNQIYFRIEDDSFLSPLFMLLDIVDSHVDMLKPILDMTEGIMEATGIYE